MDKRQHRKPAATPSGFWRTVRRLMLGAFTTIAVGFFVYADMLATDYYREEMAPVVTIHLDVGGNLGDFIQKYDRWRDAGRQVRVDGVCISACTLAIGLINPDHLCATPHAKFAFHSAWAGFIPQFSPEGTRLEWHIFPPELRMWLAANGFDGEGATANHPNLLYLEGEAVYDFVRKCV